MVRRDKRRRLGLRLGSRHVSECDAPNWAIPPNAAVTAGNERGGFGLQVGRRAREPNADAHAAGGAVGRIMRALWRRKTILKDLVVRGRLRLHGAVVIQRLGMS
jgi:hypothetical protein